MPTISEFFYPAELKKVIQSLEANDNLRKGPLCNLERKVNVVSLALLLVFLILMYSDGVIVGGISLVISVVIVRACVMSESKFFMAIANGDRSQAIVQKIKINEFIRTAPNANVLCKIIKSGEKALLKRLPCPGGIIEGLEVGQSVLLYCDLEYSNTAVLEGSHQFREYCLQRNLMD